MLRCLCKNVNASKSTYIYMYSTYTCNIKHTTLKLTKFSGRAHYILFLFCSFLTERAHTRCFYYKSYRRLFIFILSFISLLYSLYCIFVCGSNAHRAQCERQPSEHKYKKKNEKQNKIIEEIIKLWKFRIWWCVWQHLAFAKSLKGSDFKAATLTHLRAIRVRGISGVILFFVVAELLSYPAWWRRSMHCTVILIKQQLGVSRTVFSCCCYCNICVSNDNGCSGW